MVIQSHKRDTNSPSITHTSPPNYNYTHHATDLNFIPFYLVIYLFIYFFHNQEGGPPKIYIGF